MQIIKHAVPETWHQPNTPKNIIQIFSHLVQEMNMSPEICLCRLITSVWKSIKVQQHLVCLLKPWHPATQKYDTIK